MRKVRLKKVKVKITQLINDRGRIWTCIFIF